MKMSSIRGILKINDTNNNNNNNEKSVSNPKSRNQKKERKEREDYSCGYSQVFILQNRIWLLISMLLFFNFK